MEKFDATLEVELTDNDDDWDDEIGELEELESQYELYASECEDALDLIVVHINNLKKAIDRAGKRNPIDGIMKRVKTFKSVRSKCRARGYELDIESIRKNVKDVAGIRIVTKYLDEVMLVKEMLNNKIPGLVVDTIKDYVTTPKSNGYSSVHLGCQMQIYDPYKGTKLIPIEIQIRSRSMNLWATLEHDLKYKKSNPSPEVEEEFQKAAEYLSEFEKQLILLRDKENSKEITSGTTVEVEEI